ncbi:transcriptional regulator, RpiR family [Granulicatella balaenopterae]|uniref:Transcriptional regulator, RpiR family n=1 Tax=Granulicatella balaenopterae TaxID=137733 RepID=A0A1H9N6Q1_9LACT|nr:MurR/RpiR family transcriptional regulator [Granulicatella balaenopterae]SER31103.1 transcriptional regulator, RpiR family [Granulicatella balaenopterae]
MFNISNLTNTEQHLINYIESHLSEIPTISIVKLSERANVSTATIVRTMKKIGYDGFTSFKHDLKNNYHLSNHSLSDYQTLDYIDQTIKNVVLRNELEVKNTIQNINSQLIEDALQAIFSAKQVYIFSRGLSETVASEMEMKFHIVQRTCEAYTDPNIIKTISKRITYTDVVIFISLNGDTQELIDAAMTCQKNDVAIILLTANPIGTLARMSDITFCGFKSDTSYFPDYEVQSRLPLHVLSRILLDSYSIRFHKNSLYDL